MKAENGKQRGRGERKAVGVFVNCEWDRMKTGIRSCSFFPKPIHEGE